MADISFEVYDALKSAGVEDSKARKAAEAMSQANWREALNGVRLEITEVKGTLRFHSWVLIVIAAAAVADFVQGLFS